MSPETGPLAADGSFVYTQSTFKPIPKKGDKVTAIIRQGFTVLVHNSSGCEVKDVTLYSASFMAVTEFDGKGSNRYSGVRVVRRNVTSLDQLCATSRREPLPARLRAASDGAGRLCLGMIASNADIFHSSGVKRGPVVERCEFTVAMDDYVRLRTHTSRCLLSRCFMIEVACECSSTFTHEHSCSFHGSVVAQSPGPSGKYTSNVKLRMIYSVSDSFLVATAYLSSMDGSSATTACRTTGPTARSRPCQTQVGALLLLVPQVCSEIPCGCSGG